MERPAAGHPDSHGGRTPTWLCKTQAGEWLAGSAWLSPTLATAPFFLKIKRKGHKLYVFHLLGVTEVHPEGSCIFYLFVHAKLYAFFSFFLASPFLLQSDLVRHFPWVGHWSQIPDGGHRHGGPHLSPGPWDWEFICDLRPGQDLE